KDRKVRGYVLPTARSTDRTAGGLSPGNTRRQKGRSSMKRRVLSFLAGAAAALALTALTATALAASGQVQFNFAGVALNGETKIAAGSDITAPNGQRVPGSILYVDEAGGKTNYLPIRTISELLGVKVGYDSATRTVLLGEQTEPASAAVASGLYWHRETDEDGVTYASEDPGIDYTEAPGYVLTKLPEGWGLESVRAGMGGRGNLSYRNGSGGRISFSCAYPDGGSYGWSPGSGEIPCRTVTVNGHDAALYTYS
ncbi:Multidrug transporter activation protein, partial [Dysosmobacter welbionis]